MGIFRILRATGSEEGTQGVASEESESWGGHAGTKGSQDGVEGLGARLVEMEQRLAERDRAYRGVVRDRELAMALVGKRLVAGAAGQLLKLWREELDVFEEGGEFRVVDRQGRSAGQAVESWLSGPEYAHFCQASTRGGTASRGGALSPTEGSTGSGPKTLGEAAVKRWQDAAARVGGPLSPVGLGRRR